MNTRGLLDQLLKSGQQLLEKQGGASKAGGAAGGLGGLLSGAGGGLLGGGIQFVAQVVGLLAVAVKILFLLGNGFGCGGQVGGDAVLLGLHDVATPKHKADGHDANH